MSGFGGKTVAFMSDGVEMVVKGSHLGASHQNGVLAHPGNELENVKAHFEGSDFSVQSFNLILGTNVGSVAGTLVSCKVLLLNAGGLLKKIHGNHVNANVCGVESCADR